MEAGTELLLENYTLLQSQRDEVYRSANALFSLLSGNQVTARYADIADDNGVKVARNEKANKSQMLTWWDTQRDYHHDLLAYLFRTHFHDRRMRKLRTQIRTLTDFPLDDLVDWLAVAESDQVTSVPEVRLQLALQTAFPSDARIRDLAKRLYQKQQTQWAILYEEIGVAYGIELDPNVELGWQDMATIFNLVVEGAGLRRTVAPELGVLDNGAHVATKTIQMLLEKMVGRPWKELAALRADLSSVAAPD